MKARKIVIHTAGLIESFQNWTRVAAALISAGTEMDIVYPWRVRSGDLCATTHRYDLQKFQPVAAPSAGSTNFVACRMKPPVAGMKDVISPVV